MNKHILKFVLFISAGAVLYSCSGPAQNESQDSDETSDSTEVVSEEPAPEETPLEEESALVNFSGLVGEWTVDAATAGVKVDLTFEEDGTFKQSMSTLQGLGTWKVTGEETVQISTQHTKGDGQTWKVTDLTETSVNICWNPNSDKPKTIPMQRVK